MSIEIIATLYYSTVLTYGVQSTVCSTITYNNLDIILAQRDTVEIGSSIVHWLNILVCMYSYLTKKEI